MTRNVSFVALALWMLTVPCVAQTEPPRLAGPYKIDRQPGETLGEAIRRSVRWQRLGIPAAKRTGQDPVAAPRIVSGNILTPSIDVTQNPATPTVQVKYTSPGYLGYVTFEFLSPSGHQTYVTSYQPRYPSSKAGVISVTNSDGAFGNAMGLYSEPGEWSLVTAEIRDYGSQSSEYTGSQLAALFPSLSLNVANSNTPDFTPPSVSAGKLLTKTVKLSAPLPVFRANMTIADDLSGVGSGQYLLLLPPGGDAYYFASESLPSPILSGTVTMGIDFALYRNVPLGTWTIYAYQLCDLASNCLEDSSPADLEALFGTTTFKVTQ